MLLEITLTATQWVAWQADVPYRQGFEQGIYSTVSPDVDTIILWQPDGITQIAQKARDTTWA